MNIELVVRLAGIAIMVGSVFYLSLNLKNRFGLYRRGRVVRELPRSQKEIPLAKAEVKAMAAGRMKADAPAPFIHASIVAGLVLGLIGHAFSIPGRIASTPPFYSPLLSIALVLFAASCVLCLTGALLALGCRIFPARLRRSRSFVHIMPLVTIMLIGITGFGYWGALMSSLEAVPGGSAGPDYFVIVTRFLHVLSIALFIVLIGWTNLLHIIVSGRLVALGVAPVTGRLKDSEQAVNRLFLPETEKGIVVDPADSDRFGIETITDLTEKQLLQLDGCEGCGCCDRACPAVLSKKTLSPRELVAIQRRHLDKAGTAAQKPLSEAKTILSMLDECSMCYACETACPALVEHVDKIVDLRRNLVLKDGTANVAWKSALKNNEKHGNIFGFDRAKREAALRDLGLPVFQKGMQVSFVLWLGCHAAFDPRMKNVVRNFKAIMDKSRTTFAVLSDEICCGEMLRRMGDEYQFQTNAYKNIKMLHENEIAKLVTLCPHCYNTFKKEYAGYGDAVPVSHYIEVLAEAVRPPKNEKTNAKVIRAAYHDSCYLGRLNNLYEEPRNIIHALGAHIELVTLSKEKENSLCCSGGGGRIVLEDAPEHRASNLKLHDAMEKNIDLLITSCPYCLAMYQDAAAFLGGTVNVKDLLEVVGEHMTCMD